MSQSTGQEDSDVEQEKEVMDTPAGVQDAAMESESDNEEILSVKKRPKKMVIDDDDDDSDNADDNDNADNDNADDSVDGEVDGGTEAAVKEADQKAASDEESATGSPQPKKKSRIKKKLTAKEVLTEVLRESDKEDDDQTGKAEAGEGLGEDDISSDDSSDSEDGTAPQGPMKFDGDLFDAEDSGDEDNDLDRAAGPEYDSAEDKDFEESAIDPKLQAKLKKLKGAAKKPRAKTSRKCKAKDEMFSLHSETQRIMREKHVSIPYHQPEPKSLQDFLARAQKKQEAYRQMKNGRMPDIEKARIIQEKIADSSMLRVKQKRSNRQSSQDQQSTAQGSQQSLPDSGIVPGEDSQHNDLFQAPEAESCLLGEDELPDIVSRKTQGVPAGVETDGRGPGQSVGEECDTLSLSQNTLKGSEIDDLSQSTVERRDSQEAMDDDGVVEQFDSPPVTESSQQIEESESLSVKEGDSQSSVTHVPESLDSDTAGDTAVETVTDTVDQPVSSGNCEGDSLKDVQSVSSKDTHNAGSKDKNSVSPKDKQLCEDDSGIEKDFRKQLNTSSPVKAASGKKDSADPAPKDPRLSLKAARQKALEELAQKGVVPAIGKGGGDFILLGEEESEDKEKKTKIDRLVERVLRHYPQKHQKKSQNVEISIVEETEEGQKKGLKLKTVTYRTEGDPDLDLSSVVNTSGNRLQALKQKLAVGMQKQRMANYEKRQQMFRMENEEGFESKADDDDELPADDEEAEMTDRSDTEDEEEAELEDEQGEKERKDWNNPFLDDEADEDDDDDDFDDGPRQRPVCAEINDMKDEDVDLFQDSDKLQLRLDESDGDEDGDDENDDQESKADENQDSDDEDDGLGAMKKSQSRSQRLMISDDEDNEDDDDFSQLPPGQDPTKTCDPKLISGWYPTYGYSEGRKDSLDESFEALTPMTRLMRGTQPGSSTPSTQPFEDSQDVFGSPAETSMEDNVVLDADGYFRVPATQPRRPARPTLVMDSSQSQDAQDNMDQLMGLCSGKFAEGSQGGDYIPASGGFDMPVSQSSGDEGSFDIPVSQASRGGRGGGGAFEGLFDNSSQSHSASLFDNSSRSSMPKDLPSETDSNSQSSTLVRPFGLSDTEPMDEGEDVGRRAGGSGQGREDDMDDVLALCSGTFANTDPQTSEGQSQSQAELKKRRGVKRRLLVADDSSDDEAEKGPGPFRILSDNEAANDSDKNELSGSDQEDHDSEAEPEPSFKAFKNKGKILQQFVEEEAELSGSEVESDEDLDLAEEEDFLEAEAGDAEVLNEDQLRDQVGRVHMKQLLDDDDRQLMRYKEMYLPDGDLHSEGGGRQRRFHWKHLGDESSQNDLFSNHSDEEKEEVEDADEKKWRMERYEREKFLESQKEEGDNGETGDEDNSQFLKFGQFFMKRQVSEPAEMPKPPTLAKAKIARSQSVTDRASSSTFLKPKIPKRGSFLGRSKENLARIAEITKGSGLNVNGTRGSRSFVFSVASSDKEEENDKEQLLTKAAVKAPVPAKKVTAHKPPAKKQCIQPVSKSKKQKSIFKLLDK